MYVWHDPHASQRLRERSGLRRHEIEHLLRERRYVLDEWHHHKPVEQHFLWDHRKKSLIRVPVMNLGNDDWRIPTILPVDYSGQYSAWRLAEAERAWLGNKFYRNPYLYGGRLASVEVGVARSWTNHFGEKNHRHITPLFSWDIHDRRMARHGDAGVLELFRDHAFCLAVKESILAWGPKIPTLVNGDVPEIYLIKPGAHRYIPPQFFLATP